METTSLIPKKKAIKSIAHKSTSSSSSDDSNSSEESHHEVKKISKEKKHKHKKQKKEKKKKDNESEEVNKKKRKADEISKKVSETVDIKKVSEWLTQLSISFDAHKLNKLKRHQERSYNELVNLMTDPSVKGLIYQFTVKTPIGRLFWYSVKDDKFKSVREEYSLVKLRDFAKESALNVADVQKRLTDAQRKDALTCLGLTESDIVSPENWLFALIETGVIEKALQKPLSTQPIEGVLFHDTVTKESYWISSPRGKKKLSLAVVTRTRTITESNIHNEMASLAKKRKDIQHSLEKLNCTVSSVTVPTTSAQLKEKKKQPVKKGRDSTLASMKVDFDQPQPPLKKKKKAEPRVMEIEEPPKLTPAQALKAEIANLPNLKATLASVSSSSGSSISTSDTSSCSSLEEKEEDRDSKMEAKLKAAMLEKQRKGTYRGTADPLATPISKSIEVKKNIEEAKRHRKILDDMIDPDIKYFKTNCT